MRIAIACVALLALALGCLVIEGEERPPCFEANDCFDGEECIDEVCIAEGEGEGEGE